MSKVLVAQQIRISSSTTLSVRDGEPLSIFTLHRDIAAAIDEAARFFGAALALVGEPEPTISSGWTRCRVGRAA
ncbi:MAG: hypothetical protein ACHREM_00970 [Polyangiales bacterium]